MANAEAIRRMVGEKLTHVVDLGDGILRGERRYRDKTFSTTYVDLSDEIIERSHDLDSFQERLLGAKFFEGDGDQRWNSYLYFWAGPNSREHKDFLRAKWRIEHDRHFARKFVLAEDDLLNRIDDLSAERPKANVSDDVSDQWAEQLMHASLGVVLEQKPRTQLIKLIESGNAFVADAKTISKAAIKSSDPLGTGLLRSLRVGQFRKPICDRSFTFGDVNLVIGQNGAGKTSILELIEALYCGRIRRDPDAVFTDIEAEVLTPSDTLVKVKGTTATATIKARNLAWYGRPDRHASLITQGFTRFNFLDTDAAFRLSSDTDPEDIKEDLSRLLVGPETSTLWAYLTRLSNEVSDKRRSFDGRIPSIVKQTELLGAEVKRLQETPSEATSLAKTYRSNLKSLKAKWDLGEAEAPINKSDRARLENLSRGFRQAATVSQSVPGTAKALSSRAASLNKALTNLRTVQQEHKALQDELVSIDSDVEMCQESIQALQQWGKYCDAGAPELASSMGRIGALVEALRVSLSGLAADSVPELPAEYASRTVHDAIGAAEANLSMAQHQERSGIESLHQREQIGQSLQALKGDLRAIATSIIEHTGDSTHCPVCGTSHSHEQLLQKIDALESPEDASLSDGLRQAVHASRQRAERERRVISSLKALAKYAVSSGASGSVSANDLRENMLAKHRELELLISELDQLELSTQSLGRLGIDWSEYEDARDAAAALFGAQEDITDKAALSHAAGTWNERLQTTLSSASSTRAVLAEKAASAASIVDAVGIAVGRSATPADLITAVGRTLGLVDTSSKFVQESTAQIDISENQSFEALQAALDEAISAFDRAQHAEVSESSARNDLQSKTQELQQTTHDLQTLSANRENLAKAEEVLTRITRDHSLENATRDALGSIRELVSYVFARIHSPTEYRLGDFESGSLLVACDGNVARNANQVSTGQRAALALSIFLALNRSAERAPPIMLIDDPVAHVDDLNALSFLDYLRDLAVSERKQIFFATADARLAALFQKKFEFLGGDRYKEIVLSR
jgi:exonuclease SbcC